MHVETNGADYFAPSQYFIQILPFKCPFVLNLTLVNLWELFIVKGYPKQKVVPQIYQALQ